jgi:flotillin
MFSNAAILIGIAVVFSVLVIAYWVSRYRRCPSNKILVVYGRVGSGKSAKVVHGGGAFVWPIIQDYDYLELTPMTIDINLKSALSKQNIRVDVPSRFTVAISTDQASMVNAAERMLGLKRPDIEELAKDIIFGQLRATIATMDIESINSDRERFEKAVMDNIETELRKVGLSVINVNISDISDEGGYIEALGKKASTEAVNQAKIDSAEAEKKGESGRAVALQNQRVSIAEAEAQAQLGENNSRARIANSEAQLKVAQAEALKVATVAERTRRAEAEMEAYKAEQMAQLERAKAEKAKLEAETIVPTQIARDKSILEAEAVAETWKRQGMGEAERIKVILEGQAEGFAKIVQAAGGDASAAVQLLYVQQLPELLKIQTEALKQVKFGEITLIGNSQEGQSGISNVIKELSMGLAGASAIGQQLGVPFLQGKSHGENVKEPSEKMLVQ